MRHGWEKQNDINIPAQLRLFGWPVLLFRDSMLGRKHVAYQVRWNEGGSSVNQRQTRESS